MTVVTRLTGPDRRLRGRIAGPGHPLVEYRRSTGRDDGAGCPWLCSVRHLLLIAGG